MAPDVILQPIANPNMMPAAKGLLDTMKYIAAIRNAKAHIKSIELVLLIYSVGTHASAAPARNTYLKCSLPSVSIKNRIPATLIKAVMKLKSTYPPLYIKERMI